MDPTNRNTALASALVEELARCGVRRAAVSPGSRSTPIALALDRQPAIELTVILDERSAGFFALGAAQASSTPVIVACTSGSAAANLHPAVVEADEAGVPLLVLTSDRPPELRSIGAGQTIDQLKLYGGSVRWFDEVGTHEADDVGLLHFRATACRAYAAARGEPRPGPVHLNLAWRDPLGPEERPGDVTATSRLAIEGRGERPLTAVSSAAPVADSALLDELATVIGETPRGLILAGRQTDPSLADAVAELANAADYPILAEPTSQVRLGAHDRRLVIWPYDAIARAAPAELEPDLVVRFGDMPTSKALRMWIESLDDLRDIVVDSTFGWNEPSRIATAVVRASASETARSLADRIRSAGARGRESANEGYGADSSDPGGAPERWADLWLAAGTRAADVIETGLAELRELTEPGVHTALADLYADDELVYTASSMPIRDQEAFAPAGGARVRFLCNRGANGLDGLVSSGIGAAAASAMPTWIITGDLGLIHDAAALATLRHVDTAVRIVVINNDGGGIFEFLPQAGQMDREEFERLFATPERLDLAQLARLYGIPHRRVTTVAELEAAAATTGLIEVPVERSTNVKMHRRLSDAVADSLGARRR